jgi:hypothetical protein
VEDEEVVKSIEALFTAEWDWFRFDSPELDWSTTFQLIPNLTDRVGCEQILTPGSDGKLSMISSWEYRFTVLSTTKRQKRCRREIMA